MSEKHIKNCVLKMVVRNKASVQIPSAVKNPENQSGRSWDLNQARQHQNDKNEISQSTGSKIVGLLQQILKSGQRQRHSHQIEPRDVRVMYPLPEVRQRKINKGELQLWIYKMCKEVFSCAFYNYEKGYMSYDQAKIYCSQNIISNIVRCAQIAEINEKEITIIDNQIKKNVLDYMLTKYPMTETVVINKKIESVIKEIDNMEALENDAFHYSENSFDFEYRENGNYNDLIMKLMNHMMCKVDSLEDHNSKKMRVFSHFYETMQNIFENVQKKDWMEMMQSPQKGSTEKQKPENQEKSDKQTATKKAANQKYQNHVKSYTNFLIGRKVSENVPTYTDSQIKSGHLTIKHPAVLRILTKWCEQLWNKFQTKNYFVQKSGNVKTLKGGNINTYFGWMKRMINELIQQQKVEINRFIDELAKNNYDQQAIHLFRSLQANSFTNIDNIQRSAGLFAVNTVDNLHSYIILYLNRVIHGLLSVSKKLYDRQLVTLARWVSPPNLISFKISDLMRCKISSKQREIYCIFKYLLELSQKDPDTFKIVRIKNRLKQGTNDLLINVRFLKTHICQIQLAINSDHSNFIKCSNKFNHYIYELQRSIFGPLTELCSIWISLDGRAKIYTKMANTNKIQSLEQLGGCLSKNKAHNLFNFNRPFVCNLCNQSYSHSNYIWHHQRCEDCGVFSKCARCAINNQDEQQLKNKLFKGYQTYKRHVTKRREDEDIPKYGICFLIESKHLQMQRFVKLQIEGKVAIYTKQNNKIDMITELVSKKDEDSFKSKYVIFKLSQKMGKQLISITEKEVRDQYLLPEKMKKIYAKQQEQISLINQGITDALCPKILQGSKVEREKITNIELQDNKLTKLDFIIKNFSSLEVLSISRNEVDNIEGISQLKKLTSLNIRNNQIRNLPQQLFTMTTLKKLNIRGNLFHQLPEEICNLVNLQKVEANQLKLTKLPQNFANMPKINNFDLSKNQFTMFPQELKGLSKLKILHFSSNKIETIPEWIVNLTNLNELKLNQNRISHFSAGLQKLKLEVLILDKNRFQSINFIPPKTLKHFSIQSNFISEIHPDFFQNGVALQKVDLKNNKLKQIPQSLGFSKKLRHLSLGQNQLQTLPQSTTWLSQLQSLTLENNRFSQFPKMVNNCTKLLNLVLSKNPLKYVDPNFFYNCFKIQRVDLSYTNVKILASHLESCNALKYLSLKGTSILPDDLQLLRELKYIQEINMSNMHIDSLPDAFKELHYLENLDISNNNIQSFDQDFFKKLTHLKIFNFENNKISALPESFRYCRRIKQVRFSNNQLTTFPTQLYGFTNIESIYINDNKINKIQTDFSVPKSLKILQLKNNEIEFISDIFFKYADNLQKVDVTGNKLNSTPVNLKNCEKLKQSKLDSNVLQSPHNELADENQALSVETQYADRVLGTSRVITKLLMR